MPDYYITSENNEQIIRDRAFKNAVTAYSLDASQWAEENNDITTATWTVKSGDATIAGQALSSNVATANITTPSGSASLIEVKLAGTSQTAIVYLDIVAKDPYRGSTDYGLRC